MSDDADPVEEAPKKSSKMPLILGLVLALIGGGGGFAAVSMGLLGGDAPADDHAEEEQDLADVPDLSPGAFVALDPIVVNLPNQSGYQVLRFAAQLEVTPEYASEVEAIKPRIADLLNSYLRAVDIVDLSDPTALVRLRSQMLRRVQVVTGEGRVRDLLITEFVLN